LANQVGDKEELGKMFYNRSDFYLFETGRILSRGVLMIAILILLMLPPAGVYSKEQGSWQSQNDGVFMINTQAKVLDRDGYKQVITNVHDSFETPDFILAAGPKGQSPLYKIPKKDVLQMELDGYYENISGWDYAGCELILTGNRKKKGYIKVFHMGLNAFRSFNGKSSVGEFMISWKRLKKIEFIGKWERPAVIKEKAPWDSKKLSPPVPDEDVNKP